MECAQRRVVVGDTVVTVVQPDGLCAALLLRHRAGPQRRAGADRRRAGAAAPAGGAVRRGGRAVPRGGAQPAQPGGTDHRLWRRTARRRSCAPEGGRHRQQPDADPHRARQGRQGPLRHALAAAAADPAQLLATGAAGSVAISRPGPEGAGQRRHAAGSLSAGGPPGRPEADRALGWRPDGAMPTRR